MPDISVLDVRLYDEPIGTLTHLQGERTIFAFNEDYVENQDRPTLSLSFKDDLGGLITNIRPTRRVVPPFFSNLLPEGGLRRYLAERAGVNQQREFFLLWVLGLLLTGVGWGCGVRPRVPAWWRRRMKERRKADRPVAEAVAARQGGPAGDAGHQRHL